MDNNDNSIKPQQTGGLKLMTVFIAVLALHVVVIGGFTVYHLMSGGSTDADLATTDKSHKSTDSTSPDATQPDKSTTATVPGTDVATATTPANPPAPTATPSPAPAPAPATASVAAVASAPVPDMAAANPTAMAMTPAPAIAPVPTMVTPTVPSLAPPPEVTNVTSRTPSGPIGPDLAPPADSTPAPTAAPAPATSALAAGPVHMPAMNTAPNTATAKVAEREHEHQQTYTVKITDSYKKIAKAHHVTVAELKEANHIKGDVLHTGQKLVIPSAKTEVAETEPTTVKAVNTSLTATTLSESAPASTASLSAVPHAHTYTVMKGDTLTKIAHKFKTTRSAILAVNNIADPAKLTVGKKLKIPSKETRSAKNNVTPTPAAQPSQVQARESAPAETTASGELATFVP